MRYRRVVGRFVVTLIGMALLSTACHAQNARTGKPDGGRTMPAANACKGPSVQLTSPGFSIQCGRRIPAGIFLGSFLSMATDGISDCVSRCTADNRCLAFSLYIPERPGSPICSLYGSAEGFTEAQDWIMGVRTNGGKSESRSTDGWATNFDFDWYGQAGPNKPTIAMGPVTDMTKFWTDDNIKDRQAGSIFGDTKKSGKWTCGTLCKFDTPVIAGMDVRADVSKPFGWDSTGQKKPEVQKSPGIEALQGVYFATDRTIAAGPLHEASFTDAPANEMSYGRTIVSIPKSHRHGKIERPEMKWLWYLPLGYEDEKDAAHFRIKALGSLDKNAFTEGLKNDADSVLLFIHGYSTSFSDAMFKAAQIAYDANFKGSVLAFSWPSAGNMFLYDKDAVSAEVAGPHLAKLLGLITEDIGKKNVYIIAHSMGNKVLVDALQQTALSKSKVTITELVMAAPDVDTRVFRSKLDQFRSVATNITMYVSSADKALLASGIKTFGTRAGYVPDNGRPNTFQGVEVIDVTAVGDDMLGHGTYSSSRAVLEDLAHLLRSLTHLPPHERIPTLRFMPDKANVEYWLYPR